MFLKSISAQTDQGPYLQINEDSYDYDLDNSLYMVLDGYGGTGIGEKTVESIKGHVRSTYGELVEDRETTLPFFYSPKYLPEANALINSIIGAHKNLFNENNSKSVSARGGCSGIFLTHSEGLLTMVSSGNCVAFLYRKGKIKKVILEDSFELFPSRKDGVLQAVPLSGFGLYLDFSYHVKEIRLLPGDIIIACSDGVYNGVDDSDLKNILSNRDMAHKEKISELFSLANENGNLDNQTALILEF